MGREDAESKGSRFGAVHRLNSTTGNRLSAGTWFDWEDWSQCALHSEEGLAPISCAQSAGMPASSTVAGAFSGQAYAATAI